MAKSIYVVGGIGIAGCIALSLMMQHLVRVQTDRTRPPFVERLEEMMADQLAGPVGADRVDLDNVSTLVIRLKTHPGVERERLARSATDLIWRDVFRLRDKPEQIRFEVEDAASGDVVTYSKTTPTVGWRSTSRTRSLRDGSPGRRTTVQDPTAPAPGTTTTPTTGTPATGTPTTGTDPAPGEPVPGEPAPAAPPPAAPSTGPAPAAPKPGGG